MRTLFDGPYNFLFGVSVHEAKSHGGYYVLANTLDLVTIAPRPLSRARLYPGFFFNSNNPDHGASSEALSMFGEFYYDFSDRA